MELAEAKAQTLGHLGLISATLKDTQLMEKVDEQLGDVLGGIVSYGQRVGAMIMNGLGFINTALYMSPKFFHDKPTELLLGEGVTAERLNDDCLGRCLDKIADYGITRWYSELAMSIALKSGLLSGVNRLDSTSLMLYGDYAAETPQEGIPYPCLGYSKDHRPDLKQVTLQCVSVGKAALPIWMEARDGNSSDKASFSETIKKVSDLYQAIESAPPTCFIADSALYGKELETLHASWLTRVPETYKECKNLCQSEEIIWQTTQDDRYKIYSYQPKNRKEYWLLVQSTPAMKRERETLERKHAQHYEELSKALWHCSCQKYACEKDARKAVEDIICAKKHFYLVSYAIKKNAEFDKKGRPKEDAKPDSYHYQVDIQSIASDCVSFLKKRNTLGRFVLASNVLDRSILSDDSMLFDYKGQSDIELGFRFIKNDTFGLDEVYLKKPQRIGALMAVMTLCLFVYGLTQYRLREALVKNEEYLPNQKGKPIQNPTLIWIFSLFTSIITLSFSGELSQRNRIIMNLQPLHKKIILLLGGNAKKIYSLPDDMALHDIELNQKTWLKWCGM